MKKIISAILCLVSLMAMVYASDSTTTLSANTSLSQQVMGSKDYLVTPGDVYTIAIGTTAYNLTVDASYKLRVANLGVINVKGMTYLELKNRVESLVINSYPTVVVAFYISNPASFKVVLTGEVKETQEVDVNGLFRLSNLVQGRLTDYASKRNIKVTSEDGTVKYYDLFAATRFGDFSNDPYIRPGDKVEVFKYDRKVILSGAVKRPGTYYLMPGEELQDLINIYGDGYTDDANKQDITLRRFVGGKDVWQVFYLKDADIIADKTLASLDEVSVGYITSARSVFYVEGAVASGTVTSPTVSTRQYIEYDIGLSYAAFVRNYKSWFTNNSADLENAFVQRESGEIIPVDLRKILYGTGFYEDLLVQTGDVLSIPFVQYFVSVNGAVNSPGRYPYQSNKDWTYYVNLANGLNLDQNLFSAVTIKNKEGKRLSKASKIPPEATITAQRNSPAGGWVFNLITALMTMLTSGLALYATIKGL